jgi:tetratricopeptide (TPR) repeat protein
LADKPAKNKPEASGGGGGGFVFHEAGRAGGVRPYRRPFWLPAPAYYVLTAAAAIAIFFLVWGLLHEGGEMPWVPAGFSASAAIAAAVVLREYFLRRAHQRFLRAQSRLDYNLKTIAQQQRAAAAAADPHKLTIEQNAAFVQNIERKSEAAKILGKLPDAHWEVFEICNEYLRRVERELLTVGVGSPRLPALRLGREKILALHKYHLLAWASVETKSLTQEAKIRATIAEKLEAAQKAQVVLDSALRFYPDEAELVESASAIDEFIASMKVSHWIEQAERSAFRGHYKRAIEHYRDALFYLGRENVRSAEREMIAAKINSEIEKLREISSGKQRKRVESNSKGKND